MEGVGRPGGVQEWREGRRRRGETGETRVENSRDEARRGEGGRTKQTELIYRDVADPPRPSGPPEGTLLLLLFIFLLRRTGCVSRDKIYPGLFLSSSRSSCRRSRGDRLQRQDAG